MSRSRSGRRYEEQPKLNYKKVVGVLIAIVVFIMMIVTIINLVRNAGNNNRETTISFFSSYVDGQWGVINSLGEIVIEHTHDEMVIVPNPSRDIFIVTYDVNDENGTYSTKVINERGREVISGFDSIAAIDNFDSRQNVWYEDDILRIRRNGQYGLINFAGEIILPYEYDEVRALRGITSNFIVRRGGQVGLVNEGGHFIIPIEYTDIRTLNEGDRSVYIVVNSYGNHGLISVSGTVLLEPEYEDIRYVHSSEIYAVRQAGVTRLINLSGEVVLEGFDSFVHIRGDNIIVGRNGQYGIVNREGEVIVPLEYESLRFAFGENYIARRDGQYGVINLENEIMLNFAYMRLTFIEAGDFLKADLTEVDSVIIDTNFAERIRGIVSELNTERGYIRVYADYNHKFYNFRFEERRSIDVLTTNTLFLSKRDGKYGFVDANGNVVVEHIYDDATEQNRYGFAAVKRDGRWGSISRSGREVLAPTVNLDNNIFIEFIGEWHLDASGLFFRR